MVQFDPSGEPNVAFKLMVSAPLKHGAQIF